MRREESPDGPRRGREEVAVPEERPDAGAERERESVRQQEEHHSPPPRDGEHVLSRFSHGADSRAAAVAQSTTAMQRQSLSCSVCPRASKRARTNPKRPKPAETMESSARANAVSTPTDVPFRVRRRCPVN